MPRTALLPSPVSVPSWRVRAVALGLVLGVLLVACRHPPPRPAHHALPPTVQRQPAASAAPVAIVHALLWTGDAKRRRIADGTLVLRDGKIAAIGDRSTPVPADARVIDAQGRWVTPGLIDAHSHLGVYASPELEAHADGNEMTSPVTAEVAAEHGFWPQDPGLPRALAGGVTTMLVLPGSANLVGGRGFSIKNRPGALSAAAMKVPGAPEVVKMACGENPKRVYGKKSGPQTRMGNVAQLRAAFLQAQDYARKLDNWRSKNAKKKDPEPPPARDLKLETLAEVMDGKLLVEMHCYRADEMLLMLDVARELGFSIRAFHHALEAYKIADVLAARKVAVATWSDWWGFKLEAWDGIPENLAMVHAAGGRAVVHSDSPLGVQRLNQDAAKGLAAGRALGLAVDEDDALAWITSNPAWVLGIEARTGSLEVGKMADVVVWSKPPLSVYALPDLVLVDGEIAFDRSVPARPADFELGLVPAEGAQP